MRSAQPFRLVLCTVDSERSALAVSRALISSKLAACVNMISNVRSIYGWKGKIEDNRELLLIVKTNARNLSSVERTIRELHQYEVPEILSVRLEKGSEPYLRWLQEETTQKRRK